VAERARIVLRDEIAMHAILFGVKRAFLSSVWITRRWLREIHPGMTAARYDMMYAIAGAPREERELLKRRDGLWQSELRRQLGVSSAVVSRMVRSLEALGWVERGRPVHDTRQRSVALTPGGRRVLFTAFREVAWFAKRLVYQTLSSVYRNFGAKSTAIAEMRGKLGLLRTACEDTAKLEYWYSSPDD
jgi:DNA-binding MarR family transcriptional regulator